MTLKEPRADFTLADLKNRLREVARRGSIHEVLTRIPSIGQMMRGLNEVDLQHEMKRLFGIIDSMTPAERRNPKLIGKSRLARIAKGAGVEPHEVTALVKVFEPVAAMMSPKPSRWAQVQLRDSRDRL